MHNFNTISGPALVHISKCLEWNLKISYTNVVSYRYDKHWFSGALPHMYDNLVCSLSVRICTIRNFHINLYLVIKLLFSFVTAERSSTGLLEFESKTDAVEGLVLCNHHPIPGKKTYICHLWAWNGGGIKNLLYDCIYCKLLWSGHWPDERWNTSNHSLN